MTKIITFPFMVLKITILSVIFLFFNICFTIHYTLKYIVSGEHTDVRLMFGLAYVITGVVFCKCIFLFFFIVFIFVTWELYLSIKAALTL